MRDYHAPRDPKHFWKRVDRSGGPEACWPWLGSRWKGYGKAKRLGERYAHRVAYQLEVGPIPVGLQLDHLCRNRACVNPAHLEPVTARENSLRGAGSQAINARKTRCGRGHPFTPENTLHTGPDGRHRGCRACHRVVSRVWAARHRRELKEAAA